MDLTPNQKLNAYSVNATDEDTLIACMVGDGAWPLNHYNKADLMIRGSVDQTCTAFTWTAGNVVWNNDPPRGTYQIVYLRVGGFLATHLGGVCRLTNLKETNWRPGVPIELCGADKTSMMTGTRRPEWSYWPIMEGVTCEHDDLPNLEFCTAGALTDFLVQIGLQKIG